MLTAVSKPENTQQTATKARTEPTERRELSIV